MRNKATLSLLLFVAMACGNGGDGDSGSGAGTKAGFDRYESLVAPLLAEVEVLKGEAEGAFQEAALLSRFDALEARVRAGLVPAYEDLEEKIVRVKPAGADLAGIHAELAGYVSKRLILYRGFLTIAAKAAAPGAKLDVGLRKVAAAGDRVEEAVRRISGMVNANPELTEAANGLFGDDPVVRGGLLSTIGELRNDRVRPDPFIEFLDTRVKPWYEKLAEKVRDAEPAGESLGKLHAATREYVSVALELVASMRALALLQKEWNPYVQREVKGPLTQFTRGIEETDRILVNYRARARAYRASLRD